MSIEKSLYQAPVGLSALAEEPDLEIEIEDPESVTIRSGETEIEIEPGEVDNEFNENLADVLDESDVLSLASDLSGDIENDLSSRKDWEKMYKDGITLLGLKFEERTEP